MRLEACEVPERLRAFHWADLHDPNGFDKLRRAIRSQIQNQNFDAPPAHEGQVKSIDAGAAPTEWTEATTGMDFVWIPPSRFMMGATEEERMQGFAYNDELPRHEVQIQTGFWIGKYPVMQGQWLYVMGNNPSYFNEKKVGVELGRHPVEKVSWDDCQEFMRKLNAQNPPLPLPGGDSDFPPGRGDLQSPPGRGRGGFTFRLPSETEWEYACRAGSEGMFCFGDEIERLHKYAWYEKNSGGTTHLVGQLQPNAWGLYDMHGNVWEWCLDSWLKDYQFGPINEHNRGILGDRKAKVLRGGSWSYDAGDLRCADRGRDAADSRDDNGGCRVAACGSGASTLR